jgi:hypothetical protein
VQHEAPVEREVLRFPGLEIDLSACEVTRNSQRVSLTGGDMKIPQIREPWAEAITEQHEQAKTMSEYDAESVTRVVGRSDVRCSSNPSRMTWSRATCPAPRIRRIRGAEVSADIDTATGRA